MSFNSSNGLLSTTTPTMSERDLESGVTSDAAAGKGFDDEEKKKKKKVVDEEEEEEDVEDESDPFDIAQTKNASHNTLRRWRQAALVLNASRRFRYTLDLKKEEEKEQRRRTIRAHAQVIRAALLFKLAGERQIVSACQVSGSSVAPPTPSGDFDIAVEQLSTMNRDHNVEALQQYGGVRGLERMLKTNLETGVSPDEADMLNRKNVFGANTYPRRKGRSFLRFLWEAWQDLTLIILMVAAVLSLALGIKTEGIKEGWYDGASIYIAVILVIVVTAVSDYRQSLQFQNLNDEKRNIQLEVMRGGRAVKTSIFDIVVGDIIPLRIGDQVHKDQKSPFLMSGCKVADGVGTMLVTGVGINTEWGLLMASISEDTGEETPLQVRLNGVATFIGIVGLAVAVLVLVVLLARFFTGHTKDADGSVQFVKGHTKFSTALDGVVKIITIAVRRLSACETMGSATTICSDKTGTLTLNEMTVVDACVGKNRINPASDSSELHTEARSLLCEGVAQNTTGNVFVPKTGEAVEVTGSPTEKAILSWAVKLGMKFDTIRSESKVLHVFPFNSEKKRGGVAVKTTDNSVHVHWKGAAEIVLASCSGYLDSNGCVQSIDNDKEYFRGAIDDMAAHSLRCVAIAYRSYELEKVPTDDEALAKWVLPEDSLVLLAIVGIKDPCRPGVKDAVRICTSAGVKVRMVTGDNIQTARAIALECGILGSTAEASEPNVIEGKVFRAYSEKEREQIAHRITVMGRSSPNDKLLLVQALRKRGEVVAVTGDGTNDAPALHEADIGLSMGIQGTEVAKESSDIIILDDNFASVVKVVRWGRSVYANIQKFIQFQLTVNVAALVINVVAAISSGDVPLNAVQLLWVNLIMDTLGALALATEPPTDHLMHRTPVGRRLASYQVVVLLVLNFSGISILRLEHDTKEHATDVKNTMIFNAFVLCQIFNEFNARKPDEINVFDGVTKNNLFMGIVGFTFILQVITEFLVLYIPVVNSSSPRVLNRLIAVQIILIEFTGKFTKTVRLSWKLWLVSVAIGFVSWPLAAVGKLIPVPETPASEYFIRPLRKLRNRGHSSSSSQDH
ncbi:unnamed protein product [Linum tenue]|uniref:Calcium-transporting ATPase n=1 Tax=Linum tenue TaxID=586396 RepID=A0AAV0M9R5_9ROSI|nr:unnamed protein product [Linum tenue]